MIDELYCEYCNELIIDKKKDSRVADGKRYHLKCVRKLRKEIDRMKQTGHLKPGHENKVNVETVKNNNE